MNKEFSIKLLKPGYTLLTRHTGGFFGNGIVKKQRQAGYSKKDARFTHIEVIGVPPYSICVAPPKSKLVDITKYYAGRYVKVLRYKDYENFQKLSDVAFWSATHCNLPYDWHGIFHFLFIWIKQHASKWFCSENHCWAHRQVYPNALGKKKISKFLPADGGNSKYMKLIFEGYIPNDKEEK